MGVLSHVKNYRIYYDRPSESIMEEMSNYDLVIIEPTLYSKEEINRIQSAGTLVLGYISVMQTSKWDQEFYSKLKRQDLFRRMGEKLYFPKWDSYSMDITSVHFKELLHQKIQTHVIAKSLNGLFLDTVGDIDDLHSAFPAVLLAQRRGLVEFLQEINHFYGSLLLLQNWGFDTLISATAPFVDGVMWESFHDKTIEHDKWSQQKIKALKVICQTHPIDVFTVSFEDHKKSKRRASANRFIHYACTNTYNTWTTLKFNA